MKAAMAKMGRPKLPNAKKKVLSIRVSDQLYAQLLAYAEKHKMTTTDVVLRGVETFISRQD
jgi:predicted transcriptional regulator